MTEQGFALTGPDGLVKLFMKDVLEAALGEELTEYLGHEKNRAGSDCGRGNVRHGIRSKTVLSEATDSMPVVVSVSPGRRTGVCSNVT